MLLAKTPASVSRTICGNQFKIFGLARLQIANNSTDRDNCRKMKTEKVCGEILTRKNHPALRASLRRGEWPPMSSLERNRLSDTFPQSKTDNRKSYWPKCQLRRSSWALNLRGF